MKEPLVIQVDKQDNVLGYVPKMEAHEKAILHRAVSVLIFNSKGEWLLQKRAKGKYHSPSLWTNTSCTHPYPEESSEESGVRRLMEEMGIVCEIHKLFSFVYKAEFDNGLTEYELDHVFIGHTDSIPILNPEEAEDWKYITTEDLNTNITQHPEHYTEWFKILFKKIRYEYSSQIA